MQTELERNISYIWLCFSDQTLSEYFEGLGAKMKGFKSQSQKKYLK